MGEWVNKVYGGLLKELMFFNKQEFGFCDKNFYYFSYQIWTSLSSSMTNNNLFYSCLNINQTQNHLTLPSFLPLFCSQSPNSIHHYHSI